MIIVRLYGGLGNQLFQFSTGFALSKRLNGRLQFDTSHYNKSSSRRLCLKDFNVDIIEQKNQYLLKYLWIKERIPILKIGDKIMPSIAFETVKENAPYEYYEEIDRCKGLIYLDGYWQNEKYFRDLRDDLKQLFVPKAKRSSKFQSLNTKIEKSNSVCVHIRRGDFINNPLARARHLVCSTQYYNEAMEIAKIKLDDPTFFIYSDDINWTRENLTCTGNKYFIDDKLALAEEFELMKRCKNFIISNSSFSWWACWLSEYRDSAVLIFPKNWVNGDDNCNDMYFSQSIIRL